MTPSTATTARRVDDVMRSGVLTCSLDTPAGDIAAMMLAHGTHSIAVTAPALGGSHSPRIWGIVSELDLLAAALAKGGHATARDLAHQEVVLIRADRSPAEAAEAMVRCQAHHLVVIDPDTQEPLGVVAPLDLAPILLAMPTPLGD